MDYGISGARPANISGFQITRGIHTDCLLNYDTVKYFAGEAHEANRYREAIAEYQALEFKVIASLNLLNFIQNFIIVSDRRCGCQLPLTTIFTELWSARWFSHCRAPHRQLQLFRCRFRFLHYLSRSGKGARLVR